MAFFKLKCIHFVPLFVQLYNNEQFSEAIEATGPMLVQVRSSLDRQTGNRLRVRTVVQLKCARALLHKAWTK